MQCLRSVDDVDIRADDDEGIEVEAAVFFIEVEARTRNN